MADDFRLLVDFLRHEVAMVALVDEQRRGDRLDERALDALAAAVEDLNARAAQHRPVAFVEIGDGVGERRQRDGIRAEVHLARAVTDGERAALARGDHQIVVPGKDDGESEGALQAAERTLHRFLGGDALRQLVGDDVHDRLGVGVALEHVALGAELRLELAEVLDDAVVDDRDLAVHVRMRVALGGTAVRRPARMADAGVALQRLLQQAAFEVAQLALGAAALEVTVLDGGNAGRIIAAILQPTQGVDEVGSDRSLSR